MAITRSSRMKRDPISQESLRVYKYAIWTAVARLFRGGDFLRSSRKTLASKEASYSTR
jgi:hypothetical protein